VGGAAVHDDTKNTTCTKTSVFGIVFVVFIASSRATAGER
jgi:hypothetical protein